MREGLSSEEINFRTKINRLKIEETRLTSIERIHEIAKDLQMVQPSKPAYVLGAD